MSTVLASHATLLLVAMALQAATLLLLARAQRMAAGRPAGAPVRQTLVTHHVSLALAFLAAGALALWYGVADSYTLLFAGLFVVAQAVQARLTVSNFPAGYAVLATRAAVVALAGLVTMIALGLVPDSAGQEVPP